ncbi:MAG TPA: hypothetical protein VJ045_03655 [Hyphomicrobiaceae bacterium]|nr:hypothetical protein [Hyphomicrobiaceae bacterium]
MRRSSTLAIVLAALGMGLGGCETSGGIFSSAGDSTPPAVGDQAQAGSVAKIAIAPVIGAPDTVAKQLHAQLQAALEKQKIAVAKAPTDKAEFTLRGYIVSAREKAGTKVSYIWDVTDPTGKRVNRITGEEVTAAAQGKDPWAAVTPQLVETIVGKTAGSLTTWLPTQAQATVASSASPPLALNGTGGPTQTPTAAPTSTGPAQIPAPTTQTTPGPTTGSIGREGAINAMVPSVSGAPGDGSVALTGALQRELARNGIALTDKPTGQTYRVEGKVVVGEGKDGKQPIQIDWSVKDPQGKKLGTVSQKNEIPQGSLDGAWGKTADAAAAAAAQGILKLLPQPTSVN